MAGNISEFLEQDHYILWRGREALVSDFYHTSASPPVPNSDKLVLMLDGRKVDCDPDTIGPLAAEDVPEWLRVGEAVETELSGEAKCYVVVGMRGRKRQGDERASTVVYLDGHTPLPLGKLRKVSEDMAETAQTVRDAYHEKERLRLKEKGEREGRIRIVREDVCPYIWGSP